MDGGTSLALHVLNVACASSPGELVPRPSDPPAAYDPDGPQAFAATGSVRDDVPSTTSVGTAGIFTNQDINGLLSGDAWKARNITYSFPSHASNYGKGYGSGEPQSG